MISPLLVKCPDYEIRRISLEEIEPHIREALKNLHYLPRPIEDASGESSQPKITNLHSDILTIFADPKFWFVSLDEKQRAAGNIHPEYFGRIVKELQDMGLLGPLENFGLGKGKPARSAFITPGGAALLNTDYKDCVPPGKGGVQHRYLQHLLKGKLGKAVIEFEGADVVQYTNEGTIAFEIELNPKDGHVIENIKRDMLSFSKVVVVTRNQEDKKAVQETVKQDIPDPKFFDISLMTVKEVLDGTP